MSGWWVTFPPSDPPSESILMGGWVIDGLAQWMLAPPLDPPSRFLSWEG